MITFKQYLIEEAQEESSAEDVLKKFKHKDAAKYGAALIKTFGQPIDTAPNHMHWEDVDGMFDIILRDESITHDFPAAHKDFVYSSKEIEVPEHLHSVFAHVTGSIIIDGLKNKVTARCGALMANAITLQFVEDVISGDAPQTPEQAKEEYAVRIKAWKAPSWYKNTIKD